MSRARPPRATTAGATSPPSSAPRTSFERERRRWRRERRAHHRDQPQRRHDLVAVVAWHATDEQLARAVIRLAGARPGARGRRRRRRGGELASGGKRYPHPVV